MKITQESVSAFLQQNIDTLMEQYHLVADKGRGAFLIVPENVVTLDEETPLGNLDGETLAMYLNKEAVINLVPDDVAAKLADMIDKYDIHSQLVFAFGDDEGNWLLNIIRLVSPDKN